MTIVVIADNDARIGALKVREVDLLISCGDLAYGAIELAVAFYRPRMTFAVRGNHDESAPFPKGIHDLHMATYDFEGLRLGGFGGCWRYKPYGDHLFDQEEVTSMMASFPEVDLFVAHNSPFGLHERDDHGHQGFDGFVSYLDRAKPRLFVHGHQHVETMTLRGDSVVLGVYGERLINVA